MNDKQFDPLDERFRQAAEQYEPPYDPEDWNAMERLLDGKKKKRRPFAFWWIPDVIMLGMLAFFIYQVNSKGNLSAYEKDPAGTAAGLETASHGLASGKEFSNSKPITGKTKETHEATTDEKDNRVFLNQDDPGNQKSDRETENRISGSAVKNPARVNQSGSSKPSYKVNKSTPAVALAKMPGNESAIAEPKTEGKTNTSNVIPAATLTNNSGVGVIADSLPVKNETVPEKVEEINKDEAAAYVTPDTMVTNINNPDTGGAINTPAPAVQKMGRFFITAVYGQEKSGVKDNSFGPWGSLYGGLVGYRINKKWSVKTGLFVTDKNYAGGSGVYKVPPGSYYREITDFKAICNILEIPILVSYQFKQGKKSAWLLTAGPVTSIMKKEEYHYHYRNNTGGTGYGKKYYATGDATLFSGFRFSPSYERFVGKRYSVAAEPFIQLPLSGIGEGSVKLFSLGLQLTTSIHLGPADKK